jgi:glucose/arabinose dehydrogenase
MDVDNPMARAPGNLMTASYNHIWSYGLRNPWRFSFDRDNGDMYIADVGQETYEEVNVAPKGVGHQNYGWPIMEGSNCDEASCDEDTLELPSHEYLHIDNDMNCIIGGYVYRGSAIPSLYGYYLYGDNGPGQRIRAVAWDGDSACGESIALSERDGFDIGAEVSSRINSFGEDAAGNVYLLTSGDIYRIDAL